ncbi:hypothetical protein TWF281_008954 [Arthrobotrys megalospora]
MSTPRRTFDSERGSEEIDEEKLAATRRINFSEAESSSHGARLRPTTSNISSTGSIRRRSVDPAVALPIEYRSVSVAVDDTRQEYQLPQKVARKDKKGKKTAAEIAESDSHTISTNELLRRFSTSVEQGLSTDQVHRKLKEYGHNVPSKPPSRWLRKLFSYFFGGFGLILLTGAILVAVCYEPLGRPPATANLALAIVIFLVFIAQAFMNFWADFSTSRVMASITNMIPDDCLVRRNGTQLTISATELVPGDVIHIKAGSKLPADVRFIEVSSDAKFDRSVLTGMVNRYLSLPLLSAQIGISLRHEISVSKALTAFLEVVWRSVSQLALGLSLVVLRLLPPPQILNGQRSRRKS